MAQPFIYWHNGEVSRDDRARLLGQRGATLWFTGLSGSGKSTVAVALERSLHNWGAACYRLDGDNVRHGLCQDLGFCEKDREENIRRVGEMCVLMADAGLLTLASFVSPFRGDRDRVRDLHTKAGLPFLEVFVDVPLEIVKQRDPKGLYKKAMAGEIKGFTGIDQPYEAPEHAEIRLPTHEQSIQESVTQVVEYLREKRLLR